MRELNDIILSFSTSFEFVKAVGKTLSKVRMLENQELNERTIKHVAGNSPNYIRALRNIQNLEVENEWVSISQMSLIKIKLHC